MSLGFHNLFHHLLRCGCHQRTPLIGKQPTFLHQKVWTAGGTPKILMCGPVNKQRVSGFSGIASSRFNIDGGAKPATLIGAVDIYVSDFGNVQVIANRFQRERDAWVIDPDYAKMTVLRPYQQVELAKTGDAEKRMLLVEWGHKVLAENAHGLAADLVTS